MKRIGILTAGGDTPALNATIAGAVREANKRNVEMVGILRGYAGLLDPQIPYVVLNPLFSSIPEVDPMRGGTLLGSSRTYIPPDSPDLAIVRRHLEKLELDGLICIGGDGTINGMQPIAEFLPCVLAPKTIDNDLGLNYRDETADWQYETDENGDVVRERLSTSRDSIRMEDMVNVATPGYATAVFVVTQCVQRIRTTAESHRRVALVEVMGRQSGYIALGAAYAQPDLILIPEIPLDLKILEERVRQIYDRQQHVVIVMGEGVCGTDGEELGAASPSYDPAGNIRYSGAAEALRQILAERLGDDYFATVRTHEPPGAALFTRKVGHTQRGGRPILFDRFHAAQLGGKAVQMLVEGENNAVAVLQYEPERGFFVDSVSANRLRDSRGEIHPRMVHPSFYDPQRMRLSPFGEEYLQTIFRKAIGWDDLEAMREDMFRAGNLSHRYDSVIASLNMRVRCAGD